MLDSLLHCDYTAAWYKRILTRQKLVDNRLRGDGERRQQEDGRPHQGGRRRCQREAAAAAVRGAGPMAPHPESCDRARKEGTAGCDHMDDDAIVIVLRIGCLCRKC